MQPVEPPSLLASPRVVRSKPDGCTGRESGPGREPCATRRSHRVHGPESSRSQSIEYSRGSLPRPEHLRGRLHMDSHNDAHGGLPSHQDELDRDYTRGAVVQPLRPYERSFSLRGASGTNQSSESPFIGRGRDSIPFLESQWEVQDRPCSDQEIQNLVHLPDRYWARFQRFPDYPPSCTEFPVRGGDHLG